MNYEKEISLLIQIKHTCDNILKAPESIEKIQELNLLLKQINGKNIQNIHQIIICSFYPILKKTAENKQNIKQDLKVAVIETFKTLFEKIKLDRLEIFLNIYGFLLNEIYNPKAEKHVASINEEYKLLILECTNSLTNSLSWDVTTKLYTKEHAPKLCQIIYVALEIAKSEKLRKLRITAIRCITTLARINNNEDDGDIVLQAQVADVFIFFLPGIVSGLRDIALEDEKLGHAVILEAVKAFGKLVKLIMQNYDTSTENNDLLSPVNINNNFEKNYENKSSVKKWRTETEVRDYLQKLKRDEKWFKETDSKLKFIIIALKKISHHSHPKVREELAEMCNNLIKYCSNTMPLSVCYIIEISIILSEDEYTTVSETSKKTLKLLSEKFHFSSFKIMLDNLEEKFYEMITDLPRIFNSLEEQQQLGAANMFVGYLRLFSENKLENIFYSSAHLKRLISALINIVKMETNELTQLEDYIQDLFTEENDKKAILPSFKNYTYIQSRKIESKLEEACLFLAKDDVVDIVVDSLLNIIYNNEEEIKEAIYILNEVLIGVKGDHKEEIFENIIAVYLDPDFWDLPLHTTDIDGHKYTRKEVQSNILQVCLIAEGFGKIAENLGPKIQNYLLKIMYSILERAGSSQPLVRRIGLETLKKLSLACGYNSITDLINANSDYFSYHIVRKIQKVEHKENVLNVLCVVMEHSNINVLPSISHIIEGILLQTCDKYFQENKANSYLYVFKTFIKFLMKWFTIKPIINPIKQKTEHKHEMEDFKVSGIQEINNFSDGIMGKSAEEMFKEDLQKTEKEVLEQNDEEEEYKKTEPPTHIKLTVLLLKRCLHFLPVKDRTTKLLVLEILKNGLEVIREWEDELLPIVHQIWSPLVNRFDQNEELVVVNYSFQLLVTLARLSKWFIRSRTIKEVLPNILKILEKLKKESYLKDKGSPYRFTQAYKLQLTIIEHIGKLSIDLETSEEEINKIIISVMPYLSDKQPIPLQELSIKFFRELIIYDSKFISSVMYKNFEEGKFVEPEYSKNKNVVHALL